MALVDEEVAQDAVALGGRVALLDDGQAAVADTDGVGGDGAGVGRRRLLADRACRPAVQLFADVLRLGSLGGALRGAALITPLRPGIASDCAQQRPSQGRGQRETAVHRWTSRQVTSYKL